MPDAVSARQLSREQWDTLTGRYQDLSYCQCGSYAETAARQVRGRAEFVACFSGAEIVGLAAVRIKLLPQLPIGIAYVHYGPQTAERNEFSAERFGACLDALSREYIDKRKLMLRIVPPIRGGQWRDEIAACFATREFSRLNRQERQETFILDLTIPSAQLRKNFDAKWRNDLSRAEKSNLRITRSDQIADLDNFEPILDTLTKEKGFTVPQDVKFFRRVQQGAGPSQRLITHLAWHNDELVCGHVGSFVGETAIYLLGANTAKGRELRASYLLQWAVIEHAKSMGNRFYDLGGINQQDNPDVYRFKKRLNGRHVAELGPFESAPSRLTSRVLHFSETAYSGWRSLKRLCNL